MRRIVLVVLAVVAALGGLAPPASAAVIDAGGLTDGQQVTRTVAVGDDVRWTFPATIGRHVTFDVTSSSWGNGGASLKFFDAGGAARGTCSITAPIFCELTPGATGTWSVLLDPAGTSTGRATFRYAVDQATRSLASPNPTRTAETTIAARGQNAWFSFPAESGRHVTFDVTAATWGGGAAELKFFDAAGVARGSCAVGAPTWCEVTPASTGRWLVKLDPVAGATGFVRFTYAADPPVRALVPNTPASTTIAVRGQNAWFTYRGVPDRSLVWTVNPSSWGGGQATLRFFNAEGHLWHTCDVSGPTICEFWPNNDRLWRAQLDPVGGAKGSLTVKYVVSAPPT